VLTVTGEDTRINFPDDAAPWCSRVFADSILWSEYGAGFDIRTLPVREYQAHVALLAGRTRKQNDEAEKARRKAR